MNRIIKWMYLTGLVRELKRQCKWGPDRRELAARMTELSASSQALGEGKQAEFNRLLAHSLQASVHILQGRGYGRDRSVDMARAAFLKNGSTLTWALFAWWLKTTPDPVADMKKRRHLAETAQKLWGERMAVSEVHAESSVALHVHDCPFASYFWDVAEPDLTPILCAYDAQWMRQVNRSRRPVRVTRAGTLADGAEHCDFTFTQTGQTAPAPQRARWESRKQTTKSA